jgi:tRNA(Ile)-lysidine synthetase-like protein
MEHSTVGLPEIVRKRINDEQLIQDGATVIVGVSGGSDSLCLLHVLAQLRTDLGWSLHVAHVNHRLRGAEADDDMVFVALLAAEWGLACSIEVIDVGSLAENQHLSLEAAAREARYSFLIDLARRIGADTVAVGHNADDQSETVLLHIIRGTGLAGLRGMLPVTELTDNGMTHIKGSLPGSGKRITLVRPLLSVPRHEIEAYCRTHNLTPRYDRSNRDQRFLRNRVRHELLPLLGTYNPNIKTLLRQTASIAAADYELIADLLQDAWSATVVEEQETRISFDRSRWRGLPLSQRRATLREAVNRLRSRSRELDFSHISQAVSVATSGATGAQVTLPQGLHLTVGYGQLHLATADATVPAPDWVFLWHQDPVSVAVPGQTALRARDRSWKHEAHSDWCLEADLWDPGDDAILSNTDRWTAYLDLDRLGAHLALRRRQPGDRFQPLGMRGKTVQVAEFMINAKIPRRWREYIPLLTHTPSVGERQEEIAWIVGWRIDTRVRITPDARQILRLQWRRLRAPES